MPTDLHLVIPEDSRRWQAVQRFARERHLTPEEAAEQVFDAGLDAVVPMKASHRTPNLDIAEALPVFGMFAGEAGVAEAITDVISDRAKRYSKYSE